MYAVVHWRHPGDLNDVVRLLVYDRGDANEEFDICMAVRAVLP